MPARVTFAKVSSGDDNEEQSLSENKSPLPSLEHVTPVPEDALATQVTFYCGYFTF